MGLLKHLVLWPATGPAALIRFSLRHVESLAHRELTDDGSVKSDLLELQMLLELGEIDEDEYRRREAAALERLREVRAWRQRLGLEEEWAPLSFPTAGGSPDDREAEPDAEQEGASGSRAEGPPAVDEDEDEPGGPGPRGA